MTVIPAFIHRRIAHRPNLVKIVDNIGWLFTDKLLRMGDLMVWLSVGVALPMTFLSTPIVSLLFGESFAASGPVLAIHIWASVFVFLGVASGKWFLAENRQILSLLIWLTFARLPEVSQAELKMKVQQNKGLLLP